jgi:hypothetical protein
MHRCRLYNNIYAAYSFKSYRTGEKRSGPFMTRAKKALLRAIELSATEGQIDVWAAAQYNLGGMLAGEAADADEESAQFLRIQSVSAFNAAMEAYPNTGFSLHVANTQLALGRVLLEIAKSSSPQFRELYLIRTIGANEAASMNFDKESHLQNWSYAQFCIGLAFFLHAEISDAKLAIEDLEKALTYFDAALPGHEVPGKEDDLKRLSSAQREARLRLKNLRQSGDTSQKA